MTSWSVVFLCLVIGLCYFGGDVDAQAPLPPITGYQRGNNGRAEMVVAVISLAHMNAGGTPPSGRIQRWVRTMGRPGDHSGHLVAQRLGGTGRFEYNIIPQDARTNMGAMRRLVENPVANMVLAGNIVRYQLSPRYVNAAATRPFRIDYQARIVGRGGRWIHLPGSSILNP